MRSRQRTAVRVKERVEVALTPIQRWFFAQNFAQPHHWNQSLLFEVRQRSGAVLRQVMSIGAPPRDCGYGSREQRKVAAAPARLRETGLRSDRDRSLRRTTLCTARR